MEDDGRTFEDSAPWRDAAIRYGHGLRDVALDCETQFCPKTSIKPLIAETSEEFDRDASYHGCQVVTEVLSDTSASPCVRCGACCAYSSEWPRFTLETEAELERIPAALVNEGLSGMRFEGTRCAALAGTVCDVVACRIYDVRPIVCRDCTVGDDACTMARAHYGLAPLPYTGE